jgi:Ca2+-binding RTX toxin-like protein
MVTIKIADMVVGEGDSYVDMVVSLSGPSASTVSVNYTTAEGTARYLDYGGISGALTFAAGETTKVVRVEVYQDSDDEGYERFWFNLNTPVNAKLAQTSAMVSIIDDEAVVETPQLFVDDVVVDEKAGTATFVVMLGGRTGESSNSTVKVNYATSNGTALAGSDYTAKSGVLDFAPGQSVQTVVVDIADDAVAEGKEFFNLTLSNAINAAIFDGKGVATIGVSDTAVTSLPTIKIADMVVGEGDSYVDMVVSLSGPSASTVSVNYTTAEGTARYLDYGGISKTLTFAAGETTKVVRVEIGQDTYNETLERFNFTLNTPINATIANASRSVYIYDDDTPNTTILHYGNSDDVYTVSSTSDVVIENEDGGIDTIRSPVSYALPLTNIDGTAPCYVENLTLIGSAAINGTGNNLDNTIIGNGAANVLQGGAGNDVLNGGAGADTMIGGMGNDSYYVDTAADITTETSTLATEIDTVYSSVSRTLGANLERLTLTGTGVINGTGNALHNTLIGNTAANTLNGAAGNDILNGGTGIDTMIGGIGNDSYYVDNAADITNETSTLTTEIDIVYSSVSRTLGANIERLTLLGTAAINGTGNALNNVVTGNAAANVLNGWTGNDTLTGGAGIDTFVFDTVLNATTNKDSITDFSVVDDTIRLDQTIFAKLTTLGTLGANFFRSSATGAAADSNDYILYNTATGALLYDADGSGTGAGIQFATLTNKPSLTATDFSVVA